MMFLQYAALGAYQISLGMYLAGIGYGSRIAWFFAVMGIAALFMPAVVGRLADRYIPAQRLFAMCHITSALFFAVMAFEAGAAQPGFWSVFIPYVVGILLFVPTLSLSNSLCFIQISANGLDSEKLFPIIRMWGTIGFIVSMLAVNFLGIASSSGQFVLRAVLGVLLGLYALSLPSCPVHRPEDTKKYGNSWTASLRSMHSKGLTALFLLAILFGVCLHMSNGFTGPFLESFNCVPQFEGAFFVRNSMMLMSFSQVAEALCVMLLPFMLRRFGFKKVLLISAMAWCVRYLLLSFGNPGGNVWMLVLAMVLYGVAFDFFNVSASIQIDNSVHPCQRAFAQGLLVVMTNGIGSSIGMLGVQQVVNIFTWPQKQGDRFYTFGDWPSVWMLFAAFAFVLFILVLVFIRENKKTD